MTAATLTVATTREQLADVRAGWRAAGRSVGVVMTMGALHEGHRSLIRLARTLADEVVVTVFVNPLQFAAGEDLDHYPRTFDVDLAACAAEGADLVFAPTNDVIYPEPVRITVAAGPLADRLCGRSRPGHFDGVLTVVAKLLHLTAPDIAVFGEKDAQQLALIRQMVRDLDFPVTVVGAPIVRDADGLALSSRNAFLSADQRQSALALSRALEAGAGSAAAGPPAVVAAARDVLSLVRGVRLDYLELVTADTLDALPQAGGRALLAVAGYVGETRLIDNRTLTVAPAPDTSQE